MVAESLLETNPSLRKKIENGQLGVVGRPVYGMNGYNFDKACQPQSFSTNPPATTAPPCNCSTDPPVTCPCLTNEVSNAITQYGRFLECASGGCPSTLKLGMSLDFAHVEYFFMDLEVSSSSLSCSVDIETDQPFIGGVSTCIDVLCPPSVHVQEMDLTLEEVSACVEAFTAPVGGPSMCSC